jgi:hypothetical protein
MKPPLLAVAAMAEAVMGLVLLAYPPIVAQLLFRAEIVAAGIMLSRLAGIALIALGIACWPGGNVSRALCGIFTYNALATGYLTFLGVRGEWVGPLLWPAMVFHAFLTILLTRMWFKAPIPDLSTRDLNEAK